MSKEVPAGINRAQLLWHSRRGMRELDLLLLPFMERRFDVLATEQQLAYARLLETDDQTLWAWMFSDEAPADDGLKDILQQILAFAGKLA